MKEYSADKIRNISLGGHGGVGKTTLAEAMLFQMGTINRMGTVDAGNTVSDYHADEIERKISIEMSLLTGECKDWKFNILDIPGYSDFMGGSKGALRVTDLGVILLNAHDGVEVGTEQIVGFANEYGTPKLFFINRMDNEHADFDKSLDMAKERYGTKVVAVQFPANHGEGFNKIIDLIKMKLLTYEAGTKNKPAVSDIPEDLKARAEDLRSQLIESAAESDDEILEQFFETGELSDDQLKKGLHAGIVAGTLIPVLCGTGESNIGVDELLDFICAYGPSPSEFAPVEAKKPRSEDKIIFKREETEPLCSLVFKTLSVPHVGELSLVRVFSGILKTGEEVMNTSLDHPEKIGQIFAMNGKNRSEVNQLKAGDIGALVKLKKTATGNTLSDKKTPSVLPPMRFPSPVISVAVEPKSRGDEDKISTGLHVLHEEDPSFTINVDPELHQTIISGQGDLHLKVIMQRLKQKYGVEVAEERPKIPYRETIQGKADEKYRHKKQTGGAGQFAEVWMRVEPLPAGSGFEFENVVKGGNISGVFIPSIEKGIKQVLDNGPLAGCRVVDVKAIVYDGKEHPVDSKDIAFQVAGREVFKQAFLNARPMLLEPIYDVEVKVPEDNMGDVMGDLSGKRGKIMGMEASGHFQIIKAKVPLAELDQYATTLRSITSGRGIFSRSFSHYEAVPKDQEVKIIEAFKKEETEE